MARHDEAMAELVRAVLETPGDVEPELRQAVEAYAASLGGREGAAPEPPSELRPYLEKVAQHAYKVTDEEVEALKAAGYSDDAIFELTLAAALGAARARLECGLAAMQVEF